VGIADRADGGNRAVAGDGGGNAEPKDCALSTV
jgi:hypothetical protein